MRILEDPIWNKYTDQEKRLLENLPYSIREIVGGYKRASNKKEQITILAQLNGTDKHLIAWILYMELGEEALPECWVERIQKKMINSKLIARMLQRDLNDVEEGIEAKETEMQKLMMELEATEKELHELEEARIELSKLIKESA